jgi:hypothetical protein
LCHQVHIFAHQEQLNFFGALGNLVNEDAGVFCLIAAQKIQEHDIGLGFIKAVQDLYGLIEPEVSDMSPCFFVCAFRDLIRDSEFITAALTDKIA